MKVVILCGGRGTRLREETEYIPKPLVPIGGKPILWHVMNVYARHGFTDFILCLGYKGEKIKEYFMNYLWLNNSCTMDFAANTTSILGDDRLTDWRVTCADTGLDTNTGGRVKRIQPLIEDDEFFLTYGDGVADIDLQDLLRFHRRTGQIATVTVVSPHSKYGVVEVNGSDIVESFKEKPKLDGLINGGFFVFRREFFDYLTDDVVLEQEPLMTLAARGELAAYHHRGFWHCMDTHKDMEELNALCAHQRPPWLAPEVYAGVAGRLLA